MHDPRFKGFSTYAVAVALQNRRAPVAVPTQKSGKRALSRAIANRDAR